MKHEIIYERGELFDVNMVITIIIDILGKPSKTELKEAFQKALRVNEILLSKIVIENGLAKLMGYVGKTKDYSITNLTVVDIPIKYGEYEITRMLFAGPVVSYGKRIVSVVTCNGKTVITRNERLDKCI